MFSGSKRNTNTVLESIKHTDKFFSCNHERWPLCIFDFTYKSILPQFYVYKANSNTYHILDDYFYGKNANCEDSSDGNIQEK